MSLLSQINKCFCSFTVPPTVEFGPEYFDGLVIKSGDSLRRMTEGVMSCTLCAALMFCEVTDDRSHGPV